MSRNPLVACWDALQSFRRITLRDAETKQWTVDHASTLRALPGALESAPIHFFTQEGAEQCVDQYGGRDAHDNRDARASIMERMASFLQKGLHALQKWGYQRARAIPSNKAFLVQPGYRVDMGLLPSLVFWDEEQAHHVAERHRRSIENVGVRFLRPDLFDL